MLEAVACREVEIEHAGLRVRLTRPVGSRRLLIFAPDGRAPDAGAAQIAARCLAKAQSTLHLTRPDDGERADPALRAERSALQIAHALEWAGQASETAGMAVGVFGTDIAASAALRAAAANPGRVDALVAVCPCREVVPGAWLARVQAPTLLVVGGADSGGLRAGRQTLRRLAGPRRLEVIPGADDRFDGAGVIDGVASLAVHWFDLHLSGAGAA